MPQLSLLTTLALLSLPALHVAGCASRTAPTHYPDDAPASAQAQRAEPAVVTRSLQADPDGTGAIEPDAAHDSAPHPKAPAASGHGGHHAH